MIYSMALQCLTKRQIRGFIIPQPVFAFTSNVLFLGGDSEKVNRLKAM